MDDGSAEKWAYDLILVNFGERRLDVIRVVKEVTGVALREAKELVESCPTLIKAQLRKDEAEALARQLEEAGADVELR